MKRIIVFLVVLCALFGSCKETPTTPTTPKTPEKVYPKIDSFTASPATIAYNSVVTLAWVTRDTTHAVITPIIGDVDPTGNKQLTLTETTTFTLTAENAEGAVTKTVLVTVTPPTKILPKIDSFTASSASITTGDSVTLSWTTRDATRIVISPIIGDVAASGTRQLTLTATTAFTLTAVNNDGSAAKTVTVTVYAAEFILVSYTKDMTTYGCPVINGIVRNGTNRTVNYVMITWTAYNANNTIIDTANGFPADLNNIPPGVSAVFDAVFFKLTAWSQISRLTWTMDWSNAAGQRMRQVRELKIR